VTLRQGGVERRAIFKSFSAEPTGPSTSLELGDRYQREVAAYRLARLLGLRLVPPAVLRRIDGEEGSLQLWVEGALSEEGRRSEDLRPPDPGAYRRQRARMQVFDVLIHNHERGPDNVLVTPDDWRLHLIDHARAFGPRCTRPPSLEDVPVAADPVLTERLRALDRDILQRELGELLADEEIAALLKRRDQLLAEGSAPSSEAP
jgi:hypothetical protein